MSLFTVGIGLAVLPVGHLRPVAHTAVLVEPEARAAGVLLGGAVNARIEDVAHAGVGVRVEAVQTGAQVAGTLGGLWKSLVDYVAGKEGLTYGVLACRHSQR